MKSILKILFKSFILLLIAVVLCGYFGIVFSVDDKNLKTTFQSIPEGYLDVVVLGSSHTQYGINPAVIHNESGLYTYINASACQPMEVSYQMLKETLKTQKPKVIVLDVFTMLPSQSVCYANSIYKMAADEMSGLEKINTLLYIEDKKVALDYILSIRMYHQRWTDVKAEDFIIVNEKRSYDSFGYINLLSNDLQFRYLEGHTRKNNYQLSDKNIKALKDIKALCDKNDIELLLIKTPFDIDQENYDALMAVWDLAKSLNIKYIDFIELSEEINFVFGVDSETWHNTNWGAYKISEYLGEYLKNNYQFNHQENREINLNLNYLKDATLFSVLNNLPDAYAFLKYAGEFNNPIIIKYQGSYKTSIKESENKLLQALGTEHDFIKEKNKNYFAIIKDGKVLIDGNKEIIEVINGNKIVVNDKEVLINDQKLELLDGELLIVVFGNNFSWHQTMNIDYASKWFWKVGCDGYKCE